MRPPIHPGEILAEELKAIGITPTALAHALAVPPNRITQIIHGNRSVTADTALRLAHWFGMAPQFWMNLQAAYDLRTSLGEIGKALVKLPVYETTSA